MDSIYQNSLLCFRGFEELLSKNDGSAKPEYRDQMPATKIEEEYGRFKIWLGNLGALQRGHGSLDYRVRESAIMKSNIIKLLQQLHNNQMESNSVFAGARLPFEAMTPDWSSDEDSSGDEDQEEIRPRFELVQRLSSIDNIITDLYKLSFKIRNPSTKPRPGKASLYSEADPETGVELFSEYHKYDRLYVSECIEQMRKDTPKTQHESDYLVDRLCRAITVRRRQFRYWHRHGGKLGQHHSTTDESHTEARKEPDPAILKDPEQALKDASRHVVRVSETPTIISKSIVSGTEATTYDKKLDDMLETQSVVSYATTAYDPDGKRVDLLPPPANASKGTGFVCPYCMVLCPSSYGTGRAWRTHVLHDLQPYVCTYPDCSFSSQMYSSRRQWLEHEGSVHRKVWRCFDHPNAIFASAISYRDHLRSAHADEYATRNDVIEVAETYLVDERETCPLCLQNFAAGQAFHRHLAYHLEAIACFALPKNVQHEERGSQAGSNTPQARSEESVNMASSVASKLSWRSSSSGPPKSPTGNSRSESAPRFQETFAATGIENPIDGQHVPENTHINSPIEHEWDSSSDDDLFAIQPQRGSLDKGKEKLLDTKGGENLRPHTNEDRIKCPVEGCAAIFLRTADFNLHMKQHGAPEFACEFFECGKRFYNFAELKAHIETEHNIDPANIERLVLSEQLDAGSTEPTPTTEATSSSTGRVGFMKGALVGVGTWSKARSFLAIDSTTGELLVVKEVAYSENSAQMTAEDGRLRMRRELVDQLIALVVDLDHPNVVKYHGYQLKDNICSVLMEYLPGGTLNAMIRNYGKMGSTIVASFVRQILLGLRYLHSKGILHRDLTANKIFVDNRGMCKISWSFMMEKVDSVYDSNSAADSRLGSIYWMAPEVVRSQGKDYSGKADIWSVGCITLELLSGRRPFSNEEMVGAMFKLGNSEMPPIPEDMTANLDPTANAFMSDCWAADPADRPTAAALLRSPFIFVEPYNRFEASALDEMLGTGKTSQTEGQPAEVKDDSASLEWSLE